MMKTSLNNIEVETEFDQQAITELFVQEREKKIKSVNYPKNRFSKPNLNLMATR